MMTFLANYSSWKSRSHIKIILKAGAALDQLVQTSKLLSLVNYLVQHSNRNNFSLGLSMIFKNYWQQ